MDVKMSCPPAFVVPRRARTATGVLDRIFSVPRNDQLVLAWPLVLMLSLTVMMTAPSSDKRLCTSDMTQSETYSSML